MSSSASVSFAEKLDVVFKMTSAGALTVLHVFSAATDGNFPYAAPVEGLDGNFYGTVRTSGIASE